jgi:hypothetical protein
MSKKIQQNMIPIPTILITIVLRIFILYIFFEIEEKCSKKT